MNFMFKKKQNKECLKYRVLIKNFVRHQPLNFHESNYIKFLLQENHAQEEDKIT